MEATKGTIPNESKGISFDPQGHGNRLLGRRRHHTSCFFVVVFLPTGTKMNKEYYSDHIRSLKREMARKRRNMLRNGHVLLLQDNAPPYRAGVTMATIEECSLQLLEYPQYSPDLAPSDFFLFPEMNRQLKGRRF